jgi:hypothetical protein
VRNPDLGLIKLDELVSAGGGEPLAGVGSPSLRPGAAGREQICGFFSIEWGLL